MQPLHLSQKKKIYLVDGSGYIFRAFYAVPRLTTKDGFPTNALVGFARMLLKLLSQSDSEHVVVVFDAGRETFRNEMYSEYKANRQEPPEDLVPQFPFFRDIAAAFGLQVLELKGYEADDVIGTLTKRMTSAGLETVIVSGDKDLMQLVGSGVTVWDSMKDQHFGPKEVKEKFGVPPEKVVEFLGLTGDSSDNVPGLSGCGPKTAVQLLEKYGDVETILKSSKQIENDATIRGRKKISEQIELDAETIRLSRRLVEIEKNAPVKVPVDGKPVEIRELSDNDLYEAMARKEPRKDMLSNLVERFELASLLKDFDLSVPKSDAKVLDGVEYKTVFKKDFPAWVKLLSAEKEWAFDFETTSLDVLRAKIVGASFCWSESEAFYIPMGHKKSDIEQISEKEFIDALRPLFENASIKKCGQNLKYDMSILGQAGIEMQGIGFDSMIASYLLSPDRSSHNLTVLAREYLKLPTTEFEDVVGDAEDFSFVEIASATHYACQDAHYVWLLKVKLSKELADHDVLKVFNEIEMPLVPVLSRMERQGVKLDVGYLGKMSEEFEKELKILEKQIFELAGSEFNMNSPKQLSEILFTKLGLPTKGLKKTKTGISTDSGVLEKLSDQHPLPGVILQYRLLFKLKSTYIDALPAQVSPITGRLHSKFNQTGTGTGRLSSSEPNLQNIPIQTPEGRRIRTAFIAEPGHMLLSADYSQVELRLLAHMSGDENLIRAFKEGSDIHSATARELMMLPKDAEVSDEVRRIGKTINFGIIYGMGAYRLSRELGIPVKVAQKYIDDYFARYPRVQEFFSKVEEQAVSQGFVETAFGRKRFMSGIDTTGRDQGFMVRAAMNAPIQGTAADLIKCAMVKIDARIRREKLPMAMVMQIHDELVFECEESLKESAAELVRHEMETAAVFKVPLRVDVGWGKNWQEAHS